MKIRPYKSSDLERSRALWAEMVEHHREIYDDPTISGDEPGLEFDAHLERVGPDRVWLAVTEEETIGLVSLIVNGEEAEVDPLIVSSAHRGRGVGRELVDRAVEEARKLGVLCLCVKPAARNVEAVTFYHDSGFRTLGHLYLFQWLGVSEPGQWKKGPEIFSKTFDY